MTKTISLKITSPASEYPYEKSFSPEMAIVEFKRRIELIVGVYIADMQLTLLNEENKFVCELKQEGQTLAEAGIQNNFTVRVEDRSGKYVNQQAGSVEHYKIDDDNYRQREESFLNFKKRVVPPHIVVGNRCTVTSKMKGNRSGVISYVGDVDFKPDEVMVGVILDEPQGKHDGSVDGKRYFQCESPYGIFVDRKFVKPEITELKMPIEEKQLGEVIEEI